MADDEFITREEIAALFGVNAATVNRWAQQGRLPGIRTPGGHWKFRRAAIMKYLGQRTITVAGR